MTYTIHHGDCRDVMRTMAENSVDSIVTDPPAGIGFMNRDWDHNKGGRDQWISWLAERLSEGARLLKPGGMALVWSIPRTSHWTGMAIEDAGLIPVDMVIHLFGTGFPKHQSKLKPAWEGWWLCRKKGPVQLLNIDACRIPVTGADDKRAFDYNHNGCNRSSVPDGGKLGMFDGGWKVRKGDVLVPEGRYPANVTHDGSDEVVALFPESSGQNGAVGPQYGDKKSVNTYGDYGPRQQFDPRNDTGSAARFFYCSKVTTADREEGLDELNSKMVGMSSAAAAAAAAGEHYDNGDGGFNQTRMRRNSHQTVKSTKLVRYMCRLITPPGGTPLDMFAGSGSTGKAAILEGFNPILIEQEAEYIPIIEARCAHAEREYFESTRQKTLELAV